MIQSLCLRDSVAPVGCAKILRTDRETKENTGPFTCQRKKFTHTQTEVGDTAAKG